MAPPSSPAINIQNADRYPASPWNEFDTDWKFPAPDQPDAPNSNPYTPSYNSFNSWGSPSASWGGREGSDPINMYEDPDFAMEQPRARGRDDNAAYDPTQYDGDIVGEMDDFPAPATTGPVINFPPTFVDPYPPPQHSPSFSNSANSSPRSRASSTSSLHAPHGAMSSFPQSPKPNSPPALIIPDDPPPQQGAPQTQTQGALGVSIHIVPSTPVVPPPQGQHDQRYSGAPPLQHADSDPGQQQQQPHFFSHRAPPSATSSPAFSPRLDLEPGFGSAHASPDLSPSPRHREFLLPDADPGVPRPRSASDNFSRGGDFSGLGLYNNPGTVDPSEVQPQQPAQYANHPYSNPHLHPHTAAAGGVFPGADTYFGNGVSVRRVKSDAATHRRGVKSEDLRVPPSSHLSSDFFPRYPQTGDLLRPPTGGLGLRDVSGGKHRRGHDRHSSLGSSVRSSPYPSPNASPAHRSNVLPEVGTSVFDTFGAHGAGPGDAGLNTTNPPRKLVTTKATHDASSARRKNDPGFVCPVPGCGSTFTRSFNLKGHLRSHNEERPFKCKWPGCEKGFARQHDCKRHEALHLNIRPYTCSGCSKTFARMDALNRHRGSDCAGPDKVALQEQQHAQLMGRAGMGMNGPGEMDTGIIM